MTIARWAWMVAALSACATQTSAQRGAEPRASGGETPAEIRLDEAGIWYACGEVGGGFCERLVLMAASTYELRAAQASCERVVVRRGQWRVEGATLVLDERSRDEHIGGACVPSDTGPQWTGATLQSQSAAAGASVRLALSGCDERERAASPARCLRFGDRARYRLATDESLEPTAAPAPAAQPPTVAAMTEARAVSLVSALAEVRAFEERVRRAHRTMGTEVTHEPEAGCVDASERCRWQIKVYESQRTQNTAWRFFEVDPRTEAIRVMDPSNGDWMPLEAWRAAGAR